MLDENQKIHIHKSYKNILKIFSNIGGLMHGLMIFFMILVYPVREVLYYKKLINEMFTVCLTEDDL
jgi:hypothetical protein